MGRGTVREGLEHVAEAAVDEVLRDLEDVLEDALLHGRVMDADGTAAELDAVYGPPAELVQNKNI